MLCPVVPEELVREDWEHNVHADYQVSHFRPLSYLRARVAGTAGLDVLAVLQNPSAADVARVALAGFALAGFDVVDVHGDVSALTNCGGFDDVFLPSELNQLGLLDHLDRSDSVRPDSAPPIRPSAMPSATCGPSGAARRPTRPRRDNRCWRHGWGAVL